MIAVELGMTLERMAALEASDPQLARAMKAAEGGRIDWWARKIVEEFEETGRTDNNGD